MLLGILSDTHGHADAAAAGVAALEAAGAAFFIHCGDVGGEEILDILAGRPGAFVWGNTDCDRDELARYAKRLGIDCLGVFGELTFGDKRVAIMHGDDAALRRRIISGQRHDYLLQGHSHVRDDTRNGRLRMVNPGALYRTSRRSVALLDTETDALRFVDVELPVWTPAPPPG